jgi:hypothetical protein
MLVLDGGCRGICGGSGRPWRADEAGSAFSPQALRVLHGSPTPWQPGRERPLLSCSRTSSRRLIGGLSCLGGLENRGQGLAQTPGQVTAKRRGYSALGQERVTREAGHSVWPIGNGWSPNPAVCVTRVTHAGRLAAPEAGTTLLRTDKPTERSTQQGASWLTSGGYVPTRQRAPVLPPSPEHGEAHHEKHLGSSELRAAVTHELAESNFYPFLWDRRLTTARPVLCCLPRETSQ